ncbi:MAG: Proprotein convertase subtilisin/kexin type 7 [uncultured Sulfurovum sp.]|uniref:Proprotein convertase subtilisin/kexin type 7 n=1 Tax=uncultured Sulfurovum sp. TaxID=269237 RepID=A0A6S6T0P8_9BACT|nr:MAG: Proprotein convertase subtilisin/kexin type 7 [uncultured Sulfurovum sp.]
MKNIYFIIILTFLTACGGERSASTTPLDTDNNQTSDDLNISIPDNNQTSDDVNISIPDNNQTSDDVNVTTPDNNQTSDDVNVTTPDNNQTSDDNDSIIVNNFGKAQLGVLAKATVKLYELNKVERKLLATTTTSEGTDIKSIGNFNLYLEKLEDDKFYLYEVSGGEDFDVDDDGIIDTQSTANQGLFHLLVLGQHLKSIQTATVSVVSEIVYQRLISSLSLENSELTDKMQELAQKIIEEDINGDGFIGIEDILKYNPVTDKEKLFTEYQHKVSKVIDDILNNRSSDFDAPTFENNSSEIKINENLQFVQKIQINDISPLEITLLGTDANSFNYNDTTQELSFVSKADFENPQDNNQDNIFELTIQATDSYFNSNSKTFLIQVLDVNETIPEVPQLKDTNLSVNENNGTNSLIGTILLESEGTSAITAYTLMGEDSQYFSVTNQGELFSQQSFDYEARKSYAFEAQATNSIGESNTVKIEIQIQDVADIKPIVEEVRISTPENTSIGSLIGKLTISDSGDSNISKITIYGYENNKFEADTDGDLHVLSYLDYESTNVYYLQYSASNKAGESDKANLTIEVTNIFENSGSDYPRTEDGIQKALDNADYAFVLNQLLNSRDSYSSLDDDTVNMNIAGAYVGTSGYTVFDITVAMNEGNTSSFNDFVNNITKNNDALETIKNLNLADTYYSNIVDGLDCNDTSTLTQIEKNSCYNLGLVRLTSLTNSVKLLFGGNPTTIQKWANGVDINSSDDLNGNGVLDKAEASACAVVYANDPKESCKNGTFYSYKGRIIFTKNGREHNTTLIEVDVGNASNGYQSFYQLISSKANNNTPLLTSGVCNKTFNISSSPSDGITLFPCPTLDANGDIMGIKQSLEQVANIQALFPSGDETKKTVENYLENITGSSQGTVGLDNLSTYLRTN